jgi:gluconokinase
MKYIIGIDIGTTSTKAVAYDFEGHVLANTNRSYPFLSPKEGYHELDPKVLFESVIAVIKEVNGTCSNNQLSCVSFSSAMHGLIAVDEAGKPLTNMITWADLRSAEYAKKLKNTEKGKLLYERTGTPVHAMAPLSKLMWMRDHQPAIFSAAHKFISIKEYIFFHLFGEFIIDRSIASSTGLLDIYLKDWNETALQTARITRDKLSNHADCTHVMKGLKRTITGIDPQLPFVLGASDGCLAHIGSNALHNNDVSITIGTSGAVRIMTRQPIQDPARTIFNYLMNDELFLSGGPVNNGGNVLQWFATGFLKMDFTHPENFEAFIDEAFSVSAGCDGLIFLPYINGERAPVWDADARGVYYGISSMHTRAHFMRAAMEGVCYGLYQILQVLENVTGGVNNIHVSGGFIRSQKWLCLLADVTGKKLFVTHAEDSSAAGAAIIGLQALGEIKDLDHIHFFFSEKGCIEPDMRNHEVYKKNFPLYSTLYEKFKEVKQ